MTPSEVKDFYRGYIACLNQRDWAGLGGYVHAEVEHNGRPLGLAGYARLIKDDYEAIPDLSYRIGLMVCDASHVAARLPFTCSPSGRFLDLDVDGRTVTFDEHVFYELQDGRIRRVWSILDKAAVEAQLAG